MHIKPCSNTLGYAPISRFSCDGEIWLSWEMRMDEFFYKHLISLQHVSNLLNDSYVPINSAERLKFHRIIEYIILTLSNLITGVHIIMFCVKNKKNVKYSNDPTGQPLSHIRPTPSSGHHFLFLSEP